MVDLGFVRNEAARHLRSGRSRTLAYVMLDAANPFFTDVAAGIEETAEERGFSLYMCNSGNRGRPRGRATSHHLVEQRVQGILVTPIDPEAAHLAAVARRGTPVVGRRPHPRRRVALLGRRRRRARRPAGRRAPPRPGSRADRVRRRAGVDRPGPRPAPRRARRPRGRRCATRHRDRDGRDDRARGPDGRRAHPRPARAQAAHGRLLRQRPARPRPAPAAGRPRGSTYPTTSRSSATTTSTSPAPRPCPSPRSASPATSSAAAPPSWCSTRPTTPSTGTSRWCCCPSWWPAPRPWADRDRTPIRQRSCG